MGPERPKYNLKLLKNMRTNFSPAHPSPTLLLGFLMVLDDASFAKDEFPSYPVRLLLLTELATYDFAGLQELFVGLGDLSFQ